jgi:eukaryotic-like serine/threonine-protein kinase
MAVSLAEGSRLGPYVILAPLGSGGMGEVYKARDTRLDRTVAIKVRPADRTSPDMLRRFEREAKIISQEVSYDTRYDAWNYQEYTAGIQ